MLILLPGIVLLIVAGMIAGRQAGRWWPAAFSCGLSLVALIIGGNRSVTLSFLPPFSWAIHPYVAPLLMALAIPMMLSVLIVRITLPRKRVAVGGLMAAMLLYYAFMPVTLPLLARPTLAATPTKIDPQQICLQTKIYTCGPAAAVTCLNMLGIHAQEGLLAIDACAAPAMGTDPQLLAKAINRLTQPHAIRCDYQLIQDLDNLPTPSIANLFSYQYGGHYVAVLHVTPTHVIVGDPMLGKGQWTRKGFLAQWRGTAHVFTPTTPTAPSTGLSLK